MNQKLLFTGLAFLLFSQNILAQESAKGLSGRHNIKASYEFMELFDFSSSPELLVDYSRGILPFLELGAYGGFSPIEFYTPLPNSAPGTNGQSFLVENAQFFRAGIQSNFHPLQLFIPEGNRFRMDLYINVKAGIRFHTIPDYAIASPQKFRADYAVGAGLAYYVSKNIGLFMEYKDFISFKDKYINKYRYGIAIKF